MARGDHGIPVCNCILRETPSAYYSLQTRSRIERRQRRLNRCGTLECLLLEVISRDSMFGLVCISQVPESMRIMSCITWALDFAHSVMTVARTEYIGPMCLVGIEASSELYLQKVSLVGNSSDHMCIYLGTRHREQVHGDPGLYLTLYSTAHIPAQRCLPFP